jgi:hypothetical protein
MFLRCFLALATLILCSAAARADTFEFNSTFSGTPIDPYETVTGLITIDTTTGIVTAADLTLTVYDTAGNRLGVEELGGAGFTIVQEAHTWAYFPQEIDPPTYYAMSIVNSGYSNLGPAPPNNLELEFPVASLVGYSGGTLCRVGDCIAPGFPADNVASYLWSYDFDGLKGSGLLRESTLTAEATGVPEPSTLSLIGTGMVGLAAAFHRRRWA